MTDVFTGVTFGLETPRQARCACTAQDALVLEAMRAVEDLGPRARVWLLQPLHPLVAVVDRLLTLDLFQSALAPLGVAVPPSVPLVLDAVRLRALLEGDDDVIDTAGLSWPIIVKARAASASKISHQLLAPCLVRFVASYCAAVCAAPAPHPVTDSDGVLVATLCDSCAPHVILQSHIDHPGVVHKLYVSGKRVDQVCKPSLRSLADDTTVPNADLALAFTAKELPPPLAPQDAVDLDGAAAVAAVAPQLVDAFSTALGLDLYGVDLVTETNSGQLYADALRRHP
ncbi:uncharacterized protein AMSG_06789 [Thecamonas trahens ATCC 50062]|uniref:inositol-1,3,4-trisphosphate 5/6-kinase n=1 Tax=Thecamonas trahens ATCC 50062 TaxID=461836 RepID=A0A0L0DG34_THETB|nr:hypothetical protein AMSG_06789 [Thecamonas trahens ATCC 50062]KNC50308.1 hypothetical protein AMSG_06789 [Thecamonas trahens ATCC 50062]|eukprot:XP_013756855.1 hypothetical protein AMSG_06789 [Thecamonas trahens ATCC 50062]